jgi:signal peptidase I
MSFSLKSPVKRAREQAENLLRLADKVDCYRRDVVPPAALAALRAAAARLQQLWDDKKTPIEALDQGSEELHAAMLPCGGDIYPLTFAGEYSEMMMFAAILVIGFRTFFLQPFKIPTNSMFPTYNGMTPFVYSLDRPGPSLPQQAWNLVVQGAIHYVVRAPADGEVTLPLDNASAGVNQYVQQRRWSRLWLIPADMRLYQIDVGGVGAPLTVPWDFDRGVDEAFYATYFPDLYAQAWKDPQEFYRRLNVGGHILFDNAGHPYVSTGHQVHAGDRILDFDLRTGDMLLVDRFSYNFIAPKPGDPFVFHTGGIPYLTTTLPNGTVLQMDQYYIKRLVAAPGDTLEVRPPVLYRNGAPNTGAAAFDKNARQEGNYPGYTNGEPGRGARYLYPGQTFTVPGGFYFAMGDNSPTSSDSRYWGPVPAQNIAGRAVFILYPFTFRWGPSR